MSRKIVLIIVSLALSFAFLTACGGDDDSSARTSSNEKSTQTDINELAVTATPDLTPEPTLEPIPESEPEEPPHEHIWQEANYQQPQMCTVCDETEGEPLPPRFLEYGFSLSPHGVQVPYVTSSQKNKRVEAQVRVTDFLFADGLNMSEATLSDGMLTGMVWTDFNEENNWRDGGWEEVISSLQGDGYIIDTDYEWRFIEFEVEFTGGAAYSDGWLLRRGYLDYYSINLSDPAGAGAGVGELSSFTINFNGIDYDCKVIHDMINFGWNGNRNIVRYTYRFFVPVGYDGIVVAFANAGNIIDETSKNADVIDDDTVFFRVSPCSSTDDGSSKVSRSDSGGSAGGSSAGRSSGGSGASAGSGSTGGSSGGSPVGSPSGGSSEGSGSGSDSSQAESSGGESSGGSSSSGGGESGGGSSGGGFPPVITRMCSGCGQLGVGHSSEEALASIFHNADCSRG